MVFLFSKSFRIGWAIWALILGISLAFISLFQEINSFSEYINAFLVLDMPNSWCPTFLTLYGASTLIAVNTKNKLFELLSSLAGLVLFPVGVYTLITYTIQSSNDPFGMYIYAQTIHVTELLTGLYTIYFLKKS